MSALLDVAGIEKKFGGVAALSGCTLSIARGKISGLIGPNGAGKTTLLSVISGALSPDKGTVSFDGRDLGGLPPHRRAAIGLVRTFQIARELENLTVFENVVLAGSSPEEETTFRALFKRRGLKQSQALVFERAETILKRAGLWHVADNLASALSGGQKKLLELARALMLRPKLVLLDEPAAGVAPPLVKSLIGFIRELAAEGITFGIVEHDMHLIASLCDEVHVLAEGRLLVSGSFDEVSRDKRVVDAYLGRAA
ncbi:MAG: ABC transporter ATP-binding protein [Hyphomicrobiales bacterium]|nr:MAG: ABC transporter ATP-binding protein [Hyphomicrobiales bacterium]